MAVAHSLRDRSEDKPLTPRAFLEGVMNAAGATRLTEVKDVRLRQYAVSDARGIGSGPELDFVLPAAFTPRSLLAAAGSDEQGAYSDSFGGLAVPRSVYSEALSRGFEGDPTASRTLKVPMKTPTLDIVARTDNDHRTTVSGGFAVGRKPETVSATASRGAMERVRMSATSLFGFAYASEQILTDSAPSFIALLEAGFRCETDGHMLNEKIRGGGGDEYLGVLNSPALITVPKESGQSADTINSTNIINMAARCWNYGRAIWLANHDTRKQLATAAITIGTAGVPIYSQARSEFEPPILWDRPVFYTEFCSTLGDVGDLILADWGEYLDCLYQPFTSAESVHVRYTTHERAFKFWTRNAGAPWWRVPVTPKYSAVTLSPFVTLEAR